MVEGIADVAQAAASARIALESSNQLATSHMCGVIGPGYWLAPERCRVMVFDGEGVRDQAVRERRGGIVISGR